MVGRCLCIGSNDYLKAPLRHAEADANRVAQSFEDIGFQCIKAIGGVDLVSLQHSLSLFCGQVTEDDNVLVVVYNGHGETTANGQHLIPIDGENDIEKRVLVEEVVSNISRSNCARGAALVLFLNCCRTASSSDAVGAVCPKLPHDRKVSIKHLRLSIFWACSNGCAASDGSTSRGCSMFAESLSRNVGVQTSLGALFRIVAERTWDHATNSQKLGRAQQPWLSVHPQDLDADIFQNAARLGHEALRLSSRLADVKLGPKSCDSSMGAPPKAIEADFPREWELLVPMLAPSCPDVKGRLATAIQKHSADPGIRNTQGRTFLFMAVEHFHYTLVKELVDTHKVDVNRTDNYGDTVLHIIMNMLTERPAAIESCELFARMKHELAGLVGFLLSRGAKPFAVNTFGRTPFEHYGSYILYAGEVAKGIIKSMSTLSIADVTCIIQSKTVVGDCVCSQILAVVEERDLAADFWCKEFGLSLTDWEVLVPKVRDLYLHCIKGGHANNTQFPRKRAKAVLDQTNVQTNSTCWMQ